MNDYLISYSKYNPSDKDCKRTTCFCKAEGDTEREAIDKFKAGTADNDRVEFIEIHRMPKTVSTN